MREILPKSVLFFLIIVAPFSALAVPKTTVTNEDIRSAILQLYTVVHNTEDKLERHEFRDRSLGEQLKKAMITIDKRVKMMEPLKGTISRLDERLATVETILMRNDDDVQKSQLQKTFSVVEDIQKNLPSIVEKLKEDILNKLNTQCNFSNDFQTTILRKIDSLGKSIENIEKEVVKVREENKQIQDLNNKSNENLDKVKRQLDTSEQLLEKYENKLAEYNNKIPPPESDLYPQDTNHWQKDFLNALDGQKEQVHQILADVQKMADKFNNMSKNNQPVATGGSIDAQLKSLEDDSNKKFENISQSINALSEVSASLTETFSRNYEEIRKEIDELGKVEQVMVQTGDNVMDTKRRVEYGVHQILSEVAKQIKDSTKKINEAITDRFNNFENSILDPEEGALANITSKIKDEIDQVWRQIGILHQQMSVSTDTLNKLQNQTDAYVNGSLDAMDSMKGKVGNITGKIAEVDSNLNYLMGRLSLVTREFNDIKTGLGKALTDIKDSFKTVQQKMKDMGPGPHNITEDALPPNN